MPLQRKGKIRAPGTWPSYLSESCCHYVQKSHFNGQVSPTPHSVCLWGNFSNLSELKLNIFDPCVQGYKFGYSHIRELKWDDSWRSALQFWHCSRYVPTAVTMSVPASHSTITILFTKSRRAPWHERKASWWNQKSSEEGLPHHEWLGHSHSSVPLFNSIVHTQLRLQKKGVYLVPYRQLHL